MSTQNVTLPVTRVVIMEDRAQVERRGTVAVEGLTRLELTGVSTVAVDRSLKVEVQGATFVDAKFERRWRERPRGGLPTDASDARKRADTLQKELSVTADAVERSNTRIELLAAARADLLRAIAEQTGVGQADRSGWATQLDALSQRQQETEFAHRALVLQHQALRARHAEVLSAIALAEQRESDLECTLVVSVEGSGQAQVRLSYLVPCAVWRPSYRATLEGQKVLLEAEAVVWQRTGEAWVDAQLQFSTARPTLGTAPPSLIEDELHTRPKQAVEKRVVDIAIREEVIQKAGESGGSAELPGLDDGGEARLIDAPARTTVPGDGQPHRVPLFQFEASATLERVCPAELTQVVSLVARFPNASGNVILAGPIDLLRSNGLVGRSQLSFAAPGEVMKLSFGSEDGLQIIRSTDEKVDESRLSGRRTTTRKVTFHVSNARPDAATIVIEERVPVSEVKEVEVQVLKAECSPVPGPVSKDGISRIELSLPPNGTQTAKFSWELQAASKVMGV
jgi:uncharacterized protein (TIGR02231 family)